MLVIRFSRVGKRNKAQYRIVVQEHTANPRGKHTDIVGSYDPHSKKSVLKKDKIAQWIKNGVQLSDSVHNLFVKEKIIKGEKRAVKMPKKEVEVVAEPVAESGVKTEEKKEEVKIEEKKEEVKKEDVKAEEKK
ncbi:MAG: 30S ribosomal protein S16 [Candidatus Moranbacteria bacterium]|jgi:small subunit ribosomal protein S16|nr:30S ribosomal protein S16 [Candidatus Moranbacteria bacterium]